MVRIAPPHFQQEFSKNPETLIPRVGRSGAQLSVAAEPGASQPLPGNPVERIPMERKQEKES